MKNLYYAILLYSGIFHFLAYYKSKNKYLIDKDVAILNSRRHRNDSLLYYLAKDEFFRTLFYHRIGEKESKFLKFLVRPSNVFLISPKCKIGEGFAYAHPTSTYINAKSIGKNFSFRQNTTIGNKRDGHNELVPIIGDNVNLGCNVVIIGNINIGNNVNIGAGTVVTKDVPDNCTVVGNPMKIIQS